MNTEQALKVAREALVDITDPIAAMQRALPDGYSLNGAVANQMASTPDWYVRRAAKALHELTSAAPQVAEAIPAQAVVSIDQTSQARAWLAVCAALDRVSPDWLRDGVPAMDSAVTAIEGLAARQAPDPSLLADLSVMLAALIPSELAKQMNPQTIERLGYLKGRVDASVNGSAQREPATPLDIDISTVTGSRARRKVDRSNMAQVSDLACAARNLATQYGMVLTVYQQPRKPLAMGNYETVVAVRLARTMAVDQQAAPASEAACSICNGFGAAFGKRCACANKG